MSMKISKVHLSSMLYAFAKVVVRSRSKCEEKALAVERSDRKITCTDNGRCTLVKAASTCELRRLRNGKRAVI